MPSPPFAELSRSALITQLLACLDIPRWAEDIAARGPFTDQAQVFEAADRAAPELTADEIHRALAAHPRIGERTGNAWSRTEQSGVDTADSALLAELRRANEEYERRFGHVYLVRADGRDASELLSILRSRLRNDPATELGVVDAELRGIARLRLAKALGRSPA